MKYVISMLSLAVAFSYTNAVFAAENETDESAIDDQVIDEVVVTGSRIKRDEYSSASPIQIIDGQGARELGLIDTASLLQSATQATGTQIDNTFTVYVLDNGPGSSQVNLRGLGARTSTSAVKQQTPRTRRCWGSTDFSGYLHHPQYHGRTY